MLSLATAMLLTQCASGVTDNAQTLCGLKTLPQGAVIGENSGDYPGLTVRGSGVYLDGAYSYIQSSGSMFFRDFGAAGNLGFIFDTGNAKTGELLRLYNQGALRLLVDAAGNALLSGALTVGYGNSGAMGVAAYDGRYLVIAGRHPNAYWYPGVHGAVQAQNEAPMRFGYPFEVYNAVDSYGNVTTTHEAHKFLVGSRGQLVTYDYTMSGNLPICDGADNFPPSNEPTNRGTGLFCDDPPADGGHIKADGGTCWDWYRAVGEPRVPAGTMFLYVLDVEESCRCVPRFYDGGLTSSWRKVSDKTECVP